MPTDSPAANNPAWMLWTGRVMSALIVLLFLFSAGTKLTQHPESLKSFASLEYPERLLLALGAVELACAVLYLIPQTSVLGAILLTGYLGGAIASHVRIGEGIIPHVLFGMMIWGGLYLCDARLRAILPLRRL